MKGVTYDRYGIKSVKLPHSKRAAKMLKDIDRQRPDDVANFYRDMVSEGWGTLPDVPGSFSIRGGKVCYSEPY